jgi:hypothetical protein
MKSENINAIILSPRRFLSGTPMGDGLENVNTTPLADGALCYVQTGVGQGIWQLQKSSTETPNGYSAVAPTAGPGRWILQISANSSAIPGETFEIWVDEATGADTNPGTQSSPFATVTRAWEYIGMSVYQDGIVNVGPGDYEMDLFFYERDIRRNLKFKGSDVDVVVPFTEIDANTGILIDCTTAAPGWTVDAYKGLHAYAYDSTGTTILARWTIGENTANTISVLSPKNTNVPAGSQVQVVRPAARLIPPAGTDSRSSVIGGGKYRAFSSEFGRRAQPGLIWENLEINVPAGRYDTFFMSGSHVFVGTIFYGAATGFGQGVYFTRGSQVWSGSYQESGTATTEIYPDITNAYMAGWGLSMFDAVDARNPGYVSVDGGWFVGSLVTGSFRALGAAYCFFISGWRNTGSTSYNQYGAFDSGNGGDIQLYDGQRAGNGASYAQSGWVGNSLPAFYAAEGSVVEMAGPDMIDAGTGDHVFTRTGFVRVGNYTSTFPNAGAHGAHAIYGGVVRLTSGGNTDYAWLGDAVAGQTNPLTRPAGAWAVNESTSDQAAAFTDLPTDGGSAIFRTS